MAFVWLQKQFWPLEHIIIATWQVTGNQFPLLCDISPYEQYSTNSGTLLSVLNSSRLWLLRKEFPVRTSHWAPERRWGPVDNRNTSAGRVTAHTATGIQDTNPLLWIGRRVFAVLKTPSSVTLHRSKVRQVPTCVGIATWFLLRPSDV
jgi:hypothetical protein